MVVPGERDGLVVEQGVREGRNRNVPGVWDETWVQQISLPQPDVTRLRTEPGTDLDSCQSVGRDIPGEYP